LPKFPAKLRCGMGPIGNCVCVLLGLGQADWYRRSDLVRHDDSSLRGLVASQVKQASQLADTSPSSKLRKPPAPRSYSGSFPRCNPDPDPDYHQRYDDHQQVDREPRGYALRTLLGHGGSLRGEQSVPEEREGL
jgi:hypothetical protein